MILGHANTTEFRKHTSDARTPSPPLLNADIANVADARARFAWRGT